MEASWVRPEWWEIGVLFLAWGVAISDPVRELNKGRTDKLFLWGVVGLVTMLQLALFIGSGRNAANQLRRDNELSAANETLEAQLSKANAELVEVRKLTEQNRADQGDSVLIERLLQSEAERHAAIARQGAEAFARETAKSLPKAKHETQTAEEANRRAATDTLMRWESLYRLVLAEFDVAIDELKRQGVAIESKSQDAVILATEARHQTGPEVRTAISRGIEIAKIQVQSGLFENGAVSDQGYVYVISEQSTVARLTFMSGNRFIVYNSKPNVYVSFDSYDAESENPASDEEFVRRIRSAVHTAIRVGLRNAETRAGE